MKGELGTVRATLATKLGLLLAVASLIAFIACSFGEGALPKPANFFIFLGLTYTYIIGCYLAIPYFVPEEPSDSISSPIEDSFLNKIFGSGKSWAVMYAVAFVIVLLIVFI